MDVRVGAPQRVHAAVALLLVALLVPIYIFGGGQLDAPTAVLIASGMFTFCTARIVLFRRKLFLNAFSRRLASFIWIALVALLVNRLLS